jgi:hypothetical protein
LSGSLTFRSTSGVFGIRAIDSGNENFVMFRQLGRKLMLSFDKTALRERAAKPRTQLRLWY